MGYFSNGSEGMDYQSRYCDRCVHDKNGDCAVWMAHLVYAYEYGNKDENPLSLLIPPTKDGLGNEQCKLFILDETRE